MIIFEINWKPESCKLRNMFFVLWGCFAFGAIKKKSGTIIVDCYIMMEIKPVCNIYWESELRGGSAIGIIRCAMRKMCSLYDQLLVAVYSFDVWPVKYKIKATLCLNMKVFSGWDVGTCLKWTGNIYQIFGGNYNYYIQNIQEVFPSARASAILKKISILLSAKEGWSKLQWI